jgi:hypothetical protein
MDQRQRQFLAFDGSQLVPSQPQEPQENFRPSKPIRAAIVGGASAASPPRMR